MTYAKPLRFGVFGASTIAPFALFRPAQKLPEIEIAAVASRNESRASRVARRWKIPKAYTGYDALLEDPTIDVIYNPLPNSLHAEWTIRALEAGKHVLCEKPLASNAQEASAMVEAATKANKKLGEAFHYRYHPLTDRVLELIAQNTIGNVTHIHSRFHMPLLRPGDIRFQTNLAGGATMDLGSYCIHQIRLYAGSEPEVVSAEAKEASPGIDRFMKANFRFQNGIEASFSCAMLSWDMFGVSTVIRGTTGRIQLFNPILPHLYHSLKVRGETRWTERISGASTYHNQLRAFYEHVVSDAPFATAQEDSIGNMRTIDAVYQAAGMKPRKSE